MKSTLAWLLVLGVALSVAQAPPAELSARDREAQALYQQIRDGVRSDTLSKHLENLNFSTRLAGTDGERRAHVYLQSELTKIGFSNWERDPFPITIPDPTATGVVSGSGPNIEVYPLWPNLVRTNTCDVSGPLLEIGNGSLLAMKGQQIRGSVVLMRFDSGRNWRDAAALGARAAIFYGTATRQQVEDTFAAVPLTFPRFWVKPTDEAELRKRIGQTVRVRALQQWVETQSQNLTAVLRGSDPKEPEIWIQTYTDSMSITPGLAPGAQSAIGMAATIEALRLLVPLERKRTIRVFISGARFLGLKGTRRIVQKTLEGGPVPLMALTVDFATGSESLGLYGRGWFHDGRNETEDPLKTASRLLREHSDLMWAPMRLRSPRENLYDALNQSDTRWWRNAIPGKFATDAEIYNVAGMNSFSMVTVDDPRPLVDTPFDTFDQINLGIVESQAARLAAYLYRLTNDTTNPGDISTYRVATYPRRPSSMSLTGGFATLEGRTVFYDPRRSFVPSVAVPNTLITVIGRHKTMMGVRGDLIERADEEGRYRFDGLPPTSAYYNPDRRPTQILGFQIEPTTGAITASPAEGLFGSGDYPVRFMLNVPYRFSPLVLFPGRAIELYNLSDPQDFQPMNSLRIIDAKTDGEPTNFGRYLARNDSRLGAQPEDAGFLFLSNDQQFRVLLLKGFETRGALVGPYQASQEQVIGDVALRVAKDISKLNTERLAQFRKHKILAPALERIQGDADEQIRVAESALEARDWPSYFQSSQRAWGLALRVYPTLLSNANDLVNGVIFYLLLLIPFSVFVERLLFAFRNLNQQVLATLGVFMAAFFVLRSLHPAFEIVPNPWMVFIAFVMGALSVVVASFIVSKFENGLRESRQERIGLKEVDVKRGNVAAAAFALGMGNLRRRKLRTGLTALTLVVMTFIVLSFTSIVPDVKLTEVPSDGQALYSGLMMRNPGMEPISDDTLRGLRLEFGEGSVLRRMTYFGVDFQNEAVLTIQAGDKFIDLRAFWGVDSRESLATRPDQALISGRWLRPNERNAILLPNNLYAELNQPKVVRISGGNYDVIGVFDPDKIAPIRDLDNDGIMPPDFSLSRDEQTRDMQLTAAFRKYIRLDPKSVAIMSADDVEALGGDLRSLVVLLDSNKAQASMRELMPRLRLNLYAGVPNDQGTLEVRRFSVRNAAEASGFGWILVQTALAAIFVLNTMIASVFERRKEISIFSAIGLAPNHIALLFFAEALVMGVIGAVGGYLVAQVVARIVTVTGALPSLFLNFSSTSAVLSAGVVMAVVLISAIYPASVAKKIAAPALDESIEPPAADSDEWEVRLPFRVNDAEVDSLLSHLEGWLRAYENYSIGSFVSGQTSNVDSAVESTTWLAPYDLGVSQIVTITSRATSVQGVSELGMVIKRVSGEPGQWINLNRSFLAEVRRQCLAWRA